MVGSTGGNVGIAKLIYIDMKQKRQPREWNKAQVFKLECAPKIRKLYIEEPESLRVAIQWIENRKQNPVLTNSLCLSNLGLVSGHFIGLRAYKNRVDRLTDPICPQCREEPQYLKHWLTRCYCDKKMAMFGDYNGELACLTRCPLEVLPPRSTLLGVEPCW